MKIIRKGYLELTKNNTLFFECGFCGCLWIADDTEYQQKDYSSHATHKCPCCKALITEYPNQKQIYQEVIRSGGIPK